MTPPTHLRIPKSLMDSIEVVAAREGCTERGAILYLLRAGAERYAVELYRDGKVTMGQAAVIANHTTREMLEVTLKHGVQGNTTLEQELEGHETMRRLRRQGL